MYAKFFDRTDAVAQTDAVDQTTVRPESRAISAVDGLPGIIGITPEADRKPRATSYPTRDEQQAIELPITGKITALLTSARL